MADLKIIGEIKDQIRNAEIHDDQKNIVSLLKNNKIQENGNDLLPSGAIIMWSGTKIPSGWQICDGSLYGKKKDEEKYRIVTNEEAAAEGSISFQTPDLRGRFILGANHKYNKDKIDKKLPMDAAITSIGGKAQTSIKKAMSGAGLDMGKEEYLHDVDKDNCPPYYALYYIMKE
jgi:hypothetical protein